MGHDSRKKSKKRRRSRSRSRTRKPDKSREKSPERERKTQNELLSREKSLERERKTQNELLSEESRADADEQEREMRAKLLSRMDKARQEINDSCPVDTSTSISEKDKALSVADSVEGSNKQSSSIAAPTEIETDDVKPNVSTSTTKDKESEITPPASDIPVIPPQDTEFFDNQTEFECSICKLAEKCYFGELKTADGFYNNNMFYMRDPFNPPPRVKGRKPLLSDYLVLGSTCHMCEAPVCLDKACSVSFGSHFCALCIARDRQRFPDKVVEIIMKSQFAREKESGDPAKKPVVEKGKDKTKSSQSL